MEISIHKWDEIDFQEIAAVAQAARPQLQRKDIESLTSDRNWGHDRFVAVLARSDETLVGWLVLYIANPVTVEINPGLFGGHPIGLPESYTEIRSNLIKEALNWATAEGFERVDLTISMEEPEFKAHEQWYRAFGFEPFYFCMKCNLSEHETDVTIPAGIEIKKTTEVSEGDLYHCYYDAFSAGEAQFFFDQTEDERWEFFKELAPSEVMIEESSLVLMKDQQIIGFTYVLKYGGEENSHLSLICIHPDFQGHNLGRALLLLTMKKAAQHYKTMTLYTEADTRARVLYRRCGFKKGGGSITYIYSTNK